jgi:hypothetical protein
VARSAVSRVKWERCSDEAGLEEKEDEVKPTVHIVANNNPVTKRSETVYQTQVCGKKNNNKNERDTRSEEH